MPSHEMNGTLISSDKAKVYLNHPLNGRLARLVSVQQLRSLQLPLQQNCSSKDFIMHDVSEIDEMLISGLVLIGQSENSIIAILALPKTQRQRW